MRTGRVAKERKKNGRVESVNKGGQVRLRVRTGTKPIGPENMQQTEFSTAMCSDVGTLAAMLPVTTKELRKGWMAVLLPHWCCIRSAAEKAGCKPHGRQECGLFSRI